MHATTPGHAKEDTVKYQDIATIPDPSDQYDLIIEEWRPTPKKATAAQRPYGERHILRPTPRHIAALQAYVGENKEFTGASFEKELSLPHATAFTLINWLINTGQIIRTGRVRGGFIYHTT
jgi:hypothetical protein